MSGKILILGANGTVGTQLVSQLVARGEAVKAATRSGGAAPGAEALAFDYTDPASIEAAFEGVDRAFVMLPSGYLTIVEMLAPVIEAAAKRGVKVVLQSVFGADADEDIPYRKVERLLENSGTPYVILRPNWFADNFHVFWKHGIDVGEITVPAATGKSSFIDARDIAASAVAALTSDRFNGKAFSLTGPEALSYGEAATLIAKALGKPVAYRAIDDAAFIAMLTGAGLPDGYASFLAAIFHPVREGWTAVVTGDVETLTGKAPRPLATYVADNADKLGS
ncbi:MAG: SDR family oxidoreductase [Rhodospirillales bacterium]